MFVCKQKTAYELRISDWSSDVCASDLHLGLRRRSLHRARPDLRQAGGLVRQRVGLFEQVPGDGAGGCEVGAPFRDCMRKPRECGAFSFLWPLSWSRSCVCSTVSSLPVGPCAPCTPSGVIFFRTRLRLSAPP